MKTGSEHLFALIHSLSKSEKRFFKLNSYSEDGEKEYMKLFDIIARQSRYNEKAVEEELGINKNTLSVKKNYLHNLILDKMAILHTSAEAEIKKALIKAEFLHRKGLYANEKKILRKAKQAAEKLELYTYLAEILEKQYYLAWKELDLDEAQKILVERKQVFHILFNENEYGHLESEQSILLTKTGKTGDKGIKKDLNKIMKHPLLANEYRAISFKARHSFCKIHHVYNAVGGNANKAYIFVKKSVDLDLSDPEKSKQRMPSFLVAMNNLINLCNTLNKYVEEKQYLDLLLKYSTLLKEEPGKTWSFMIFHHNNLLHYIKTGRYEEVLPIADKLYRELEVYEQKLDEVQKVILLFNIALICFGAEKNSRCIQLLNKIRDKEHVLHVRPDLESSIEVFNLIVQYEKGNYEMLPNIVQSVRKRLHLRKQSNEIVNILLDFFVKTFFLRHSKKELRDKFRGLKRSVIASMKQAKDILLLDGFDVVSWIDSKIENKSFAEVVREKAHKM